jgi:DNA-binding beta-propeller fold protein YncE
VQVIDAKSFTSEGSVTLGLRTSASGLTFNPDGEYAYVTDSSTNQVVTLGYISTAPYFEVLSGGTYTGSSSFHPTSITVSNDDATAYVSDGSGIDVSTTLSSGVFTGLASTVSLSSTAGSSAISADDSTLYVQMSGTDDVAAIRLETGYPVSYWTSGVAAGPLAITVDGGTLALGAASSSTLDLMSTVSASVENAVSLDGTPVAVVPAAPVTLDLEAFVTEETGGSVAMVNVTTGTLDQTVSVGSDPVAVAASPNGQFAFVANYGGHSVSVMQNDNMDTTSNVVISTISLPSGAEPDAVAVTPDGDRVLVVDEGTGEVSVIDSNPSDGSSYLTVLSTIYLDGSGTASSTMLPDAIALSPDGTYAYVTDGGDATVSVLSLSSPNTYAWQANASSLGFHGEPQDIAISPNDQIAYVTDSPTSGDGYLWALPIDPGNGVPQVGTSATVGDDPSGVALCPPRRGTRRATGGRPRVTGSRAPTPTGQHVRPRARPRRRPSTPTTGTAFAPPPASARATPTSRGGASTATPTSFRTAPGTSSTPTAATRRSSRSPRRDRARRATSSFPTRAATFAVSCSCRREPTRTSSSTTPTTTPTETPSPNREDRPRPAASRHPRRASARATWARHRGGSGRATWTPPGSSTSSTATTTR